jgi:uncharacterized protein
MAGLYRHQVVRDLAWLIESPALLCSDIAGVPLPPAPWLQGIVDESASWLAHLDEDGELAARIYAEAAQSPRPTVRLGQYAERLVEIWLRACPTISVRGARIDVSDHGRTLGDLDIVFADRNRPGLVHWEIAVKFYLRDDRSGDWLGLDSADCLDDKLQRLRTHQLPLGRQAQLRGIIPAGVELASEAFIKGWVFDNEASAGRGPVIAEQAPRCWWLRHGAGDIPSAARSSRFAIVHRDEWLSPLHRPDDGVFEPRTLRETEQRLDDYFTRVGKPALVCEVQRDEHGWWREINRGLVVAPDW